MKLPNSNFVSNYGETFVQTFDLSTDLELGVRTKYVAQALTKIKRKMSKTSDGLFLVNCHDGTRL